MSIRIKSFLVKIALAVLFVATIGMLLVNVNFNKTSAATDPIFAVEQGVYLKEVNVKDATDSTAMRWTVTVNNAFYKQYEGATYTFKLTLTDESSLTRDFTTAVNSNNGDLVYNFDLYDAPESMYSEVVKVEAFVTVDGNEIHAAGDGFVRSLEYASALAIAQGETGFDKYVGAEEGQAQAFVDTVLKYAEDVNVNTNGSAEFDVANLDGSVIDETYKIYINGEYALNADKDVLLALPGSTGVDMTEFIASELCVKNALNTMVIIAEGNVYTVNFKATDFAMGTYEDFAAFIEYIKELPDSDSIEDAKNPVYNGDGIKALLTANIDCLENSLTAKTSGTVGAFNDGELDGQGYVISNVKVTYKANSLFNNLRGTTLKNIGFVNIVSDSGTQNYIPALLSWNSLIDCVLENVYIDGTVGFYNQKTGAGLTADATGTVFKNCIIKVETLWPGRYQLPVIAYQGKSPELQNTYTVSVGCSDYTFNGNSTQIEENAAPYVNSTFVQTLFEANSAIFANAESLEAFKNSPVWTVENGVVYFTNAYTEYTPLETLEFYKYTNGTKYKTLTADLSKYGIENIESVKLAGADIDGCTVEGAVITIADVSVLGSSIDRIGGTNPSSHSYVANTYVKPIELTIVADGETYVLPVNVIDYALTSYDDFAMFVSDVNTYGTSVDTNKVAAKRYNVILLNSFEYTRVASDGTLRGHQSDNANFQGVIDGRGYTINNLRIQNYLFRKQAGATIKNIAFTNMIALSYTANGSGVTGDATWGCFFGENAAAGALRVMNSYIQMTVDAATLKGGFYPNSNYVDTYINTLFDYTFTANSTQQYVELCTSYPAVYISSPIIYKVTEDRTTAINGLFGKVTGTGTTQGTLVKYLKGYTSYADFFADANTAKTYYDWGLEYGSNYWNFNYDLDGNVTSIQWKTAANAIVNPGVAE